jgi:hypothetical protein
MAKDNITQLPASSAKANGRSVTFGVCAAGDPRIDEASRARCAKIVETIAAKVARQVKLPDGSPVQVVWSPTQIGRAHV